MKFWQSLTVAIIGGIIGGLATFAVQERQLRKAYLLEDQAARVAHELLQSSEWPFRSFRVIQHHLGGICKDDLRRLLVKTGAVRWQSDDGIEVWGLVERNKGSLSKPRRPEAVEKDKPEKYFENRECA